VFLYALALAWNTPSQGAGHHELNPAQVDQIRALQEEKRSRSPVQRKMDSQLIYGLRQKREGMAAPGAASLKPVLTIGSDGKLMVDIDGAVGPALLNSVRNGGGVVINSFPRYHTVRALVSLELAETLAARPEVVALRPADLAITHVGALPFEGDIAHRADTARQVFGANGQGIKIGVLSDSVDYLTLVTSAGQLPSITVLPGQSGFGNGEGTAMLEIVHALAPDSELYFATASAGMASFAQNIRDLAAAGCRIIVDDVSYFRESPFQDGLISQAVADVSSAGTLFFSSAGNWGSQDKGTSSTWEGDYQPGGVFTNGLPGELHDFGGALYNEVLPGGGFYRLDLFWSDPLGASTNDYDVYVFDSSDNLVRSSTNLQQGNADPYEVIPSLDPGNRIVILKASGESRHLFLTTGRGRLAITTGGSVRGHNASGAANAFSVAATRVDSPPVPFTVGMTNLVEYFSGDGPRRIFFDRDGNALTPGDYLTSGGVVLQKPDFTAADGVSTTVPGFSRFLGTSAAAPHAAAIASLLWSSDPSLTPDDIRSILVGSALDIEQPGFDRNSGAGVLDALEAVSSARIKIAIQSVVFNDANTNHILDRNECAELVIALQNLPAPARLTATGVTAVLTCSTPGVIVDPLPRSFGDLPPDGTTVANASFRISTMPDYLGGELVEFALQIGASNQIVRPSVFQLDSVASGRGVPVGFASTTPVAIPDLSTVESSLDVQNFDSPLAAVKVGVSLLHTYDSDLLLSLITPDGSEIVLSQGVGVDGQNYGAGCDAMTLFSDEAPAGILDGLPPFLGAFRPQQPLRTLSGKAGNAVNGRWTLRVADQVELDSGTLSCWSLELTPLTVSPGDGGCLFPPRVSTEPLDQSVAPGDTIQFGVIVEGTDPLAFQWFFNGTNSLEAATNATLVLSNVTLASGGAYQVVVSSFLGTVTSRVATLTVTVPLSFICPTNRTFDLATAWDFDTPIINATNLNLVSMGATTNFDGCGGYSATRSWSLTDDAGNQALCRQTVSVVNPQPPVLSCATPKTVPAGTVWDFDPPAAQQSGDVAAVVYDNLLPDLESQFNPGSLEVGNEVVLSGSERNAGRFSFQVWAGGAVPGVFEGGVQARLRFYQNDGPLSDSGRASPGTLLYDSGLVGVPPAPQAVMVFQDFQVNAATALTQPLPDAFTWTVQFSGLAGDDAVGLELHSPPVVGTTYLEYWENDGGTWTQKTNSDLTVSFAARLEAFSRSVVVTTEGTITNFDGGGGFTARRTWQAADPCGRKAVCSQEVTVVSPPTLLSGPSDLVTTNGNRVEFVVAASGTPPLAYQWMFNETNVLTDATNTSLVFDPVDIGKYGSYQIMVSNAAGSIVSTSAALVVVLPTSLLCYPDRTVPLGVPWDFDPPAATGTNVTVSEVTTTTNAGSCGTFSATRIWLASDPFGNSATCGQTVAVVDTQPPWFVCAPDKLVAVGVPWDFDDPTVQSAAQVTEVVYDNTLNDLALQFDPGLAEVGNEIVLGGTNRFPGVFALQYWATNALSEELAGNVQARVRFYQNDGPLLENGSPSPGTIIFDSGPLGVSSTSRASVMIQDFVAGAAVPLMTNLPDAFTWAVQFTGLEGADAAGLDLYSAPAVGSVSPDYWQQDAGSWSQPTNSGGPVTFAVRIGAVEPPVQTAVMGTVTNADSSGGFVATRTWQTIKPCGSMASCSQSVTVLSPPDLSANLADVVATNGDRVELTVLASGSPPLNYQWWFNATNVLSIGTGPSIVLSNVTAADSGGYSVVVSNPVGVVTSLMANLVILMPPVITVQPSSAVLPRGQTASFTVAAKGAPVPAYQWVFNDTNLVEGATDRVLTLTNVDDANAGTYSVLVSNDVGVVSSTPVLLAVGDPPRIVLPPQDLALLEGGSGEFAVDAQGTPPLGYSWYLNLTNPVGNTVEPTLVLSNVTHAQRGAYSVTVSNAFGMVTSPPASLRVLAPSGFLSFSYSASGVALTFSTEPQRLYTIYVSTNLAGSDWVPLPKADRRLGTGNPVTVKDPQAMDEERFYRLVVE
jgi:subtilisin-like proprotein convertase family protein